MEKNYASKFLGNAQSLQQKILELIIVKICEFTPFYTPWPSCFLPPLSTTNKLVFTQAAYRVRIVPPFTRIQEAASGRRAAVPHQCAATPNSRIVHLFDYFKVDYLGQCRLIMMFSPNDLNSQRTNAFWWKMPKQKTPEIWFAPLCNFPTKTNLSFHLFIKVDWYLL